MKQRYAFAAEPEEVKKFDEIAETQDRSRSAMISFLIKQFIKKEEKKDNAITN